MYAVTKNEGFDGYADSVVPIKLHSNGCYIPCDEADADGFCAKIAKKQATEDGGAIVAMVDTVYCFAGKRMHGDEPTGSFEQFNAAAQLAEIEEAYDAN